MVFNRGKTWREKGKREVQWFTLGEAAELVQEPGLVALLQNVTQLDKVFE